jgi:hypothetical protein
MKFPKQSICKRCQRAMTQVANILPMGGSPGLVAFLCARCGKSDSILVEPIRHAEPSPASSHWALLESFPLHANAKQSI